MRAYGGPYWTDDAPHRHTISDEGGTIDGFGTVGHAVAEASDLAAARLALGIVVKEAADNTAPPAGVDLVFRKSG